MDAGERLRQWLVEGLKQPGKSQSDCARFMSVTPQVINRMARGHRRIQVDEIPQLSQYLESVPPGALASAPQYLWVEAAVLREGIWMEASAGEPRMSPLQPISHPSFAGAEQYCVSIDLAAQASSAPLQFAICGRLGRRVPHDFIGRGSGLMHVAFRRDDLFAHRLCSLSATEQTLTLGNGADERRPLPETSEVVGVVLAKVEVLCG